MDYRQNPPFVRPDAHLAGTMVVAALLGAIRLVVLLTATGTVDAGGLDDGSGAIEVMTEVVILPELQLEEYYYTLETLASLRVVIVDVGRSDLVDSLVEITSDSVLTSSVHISLLDKEM